MHSNISVLLGTVYVQFKALEISTHGNRSDCSLTPEALPPLGSYVDRWTGGLEQEQRQRDGDSDIGTGTRTGQRGRGSDIGTGTEG